MRYDPRNLKTLLEMKTPVKASELQQFICAVNWMRTAIPEYNKEIAPLQNLLESVCSSTGKRTKRALSSVDISAKWELVHKESFEKIKKYIGNETSLSFPKDGYSICLFTDASDFHWSAVLVQTPSKHMDEPIDERTYQPLGFLSGSFKGSALN